MFRLTQINGDEYSTGLCLATIPLPFHLVTKLVAAYGETDITGPGNKRTSPFPKATSGPRIWQCGQVWIAEFGVLYLNCQTCGSPKMPGQGCMTCVEHVANTPVYSRKVEMWAARPALCCDTSPTAATSWRRKATW